MIYRELIDFLESNGCYPIEEGQYDEGTYYRNCVNSEMCYVEKVKSFSSLAIVHIVFELKIAPPFELEDDYEVYKNNRTKIYKGLIVKSKQ